MRLFAFSTVFLLIASGIGGCVQESGTPPTAQESTLPGSGGNTSASSSSKAAPATGGKKSTTKTTTAKEEEGGSGGTTEAETSTDDPEGSGGMTAKSSSKESAGGTKNSSSTKSSTSKGGTGGASTKATTSKGGAGGAGGSGGSSAKGGTSAKATTTTAVSGPRVTPSGTDGFATRYWDCCKPTCAWKNNAGGKGIPSCGQGNNNMGVSESQSACTNGDAYMCWNFVPWSVNDGQAYAFAAFNSGSKCGECYELQFTGKSNSGTNADKSCAPLEGKSLIVQIINTGNIQQGQFDLLIPGGGVGEFNACNKQWGGNVNLGAQYGGFGMTCNYGSFCVKEMCNAVFQDKPDLLKGCLWYTTWLNSADNPKLKYKKVNCPAAITALSGISA
ncbi:MAG: hypothetical protein ACM3ZE_05415 [Myxococcales bacterium]